MPWRHRGYQFSGDGGDTLRVTATGSASTPNERLVKIALAAAAQHGAEQFKKTFRAGRTAYSVKCGKTTVTERGATRKIAPTDYRVATVDVTFGNHRPIPPIVPPKETAAALLAELQAETIRPKRRQRSSPAGAGLRTLAAVDGTHCRLFRTQLEAGHANLPWMWL